MTAVRGTTLHERIAAQLRQRVQQGILAPGSRVPSERTLSDEFKVSRLTVRRALQDLEKEGHVQVIGGIRWLARSGGNSIEEGGSGLVSFSDLASANGFAVTSRVLKHQMRPSTIDEAGTLGIVPGAPVLDLVRLRYLDDIPVVVDFTLIPETIAPGLDDVDFGEVSLYETLSQRFGVHPTSADCVIEARGADADFAAHLELGVGDPTLDIMQVIYDVGGRTIQSGRSVYRGDRYRFRAMLESGRTANGTVNRAVSRHAKASW